MKTHTAILLLTLCAAVLKADSWSYPSENLTKESDNGLYRFTAILPPRESKENIKHCIGVLEKVQGKQSEQRWKQRLVHEVTPLDAIVTDNGEYTITFDNWFGVGSDPIVIYDKHGKLVKRHTLESLDLKKYSEGQGWSQTEDGFGTSRGLISRSTSSIHWRKDALTLLSEDQKRLIIRMYWGHLVVVDLKNGDLMKKEDFSIDLEYISEHTKIAVDRLLYSENADDRRKGSVIAGSTGDIMYRVRLKELLEDPEFFTGYTTRGSIYIGSYKEYYVRKAAYEALEMLGIRVDGVVLKDEFFSDKDMNSVLEMNQRISNKSR